MPLTATIESFLIITDIIAATWFYAKVVVD